jgi:hypothetical protein
MIISFVPAAGKSPCLMQNHRKANERAGGDGGAKAKGHISTYNISVSTPPGPTPGRFNAGRQVRTRLVPTVTGPIYDLSFTSCALSA